MSAGTIAQVDPTTLTIALNVRTDVKVDKEFVASIKTLGILQPPMVTPNGDGGYDVVLGQRRTLAAVEAGLKTIPVYVVDQSEADAARVVDQLTENDQRQGLSEAERVAGYKQLSLFGLSPAQIVKRTARPKAVIEKALAVADDEVASAALVEHELTLDQASYLVEFSDDKAAVKKLVAAAGAGQLDHVVGSLRRSRALVEQVAALEAELVAEKVIPMQRSTSSYSGVAGDDPDGLVRLDKLGKPGAPTEPLEVSGVPKKALAGRVVQEYMSHEGGYREWAAKQYFVLNPDEHGIPKLEHSRGPASELTPEDQAEEDARQAERLAQQERDGALVAAREVRTEWLSELMQRKTLPGDALAVVAKSTLFSPLDVNNDVFPLLSIPIPENGVTDEDLEDLLTGFIDAAPKVNPVRLLLAIMIAEAERDMRSSWRAAEVAVWYFPVLVAWGYGLSDAEKSLLPGEETAVAA